ncbi:BolA family protein [Thiocystis violacea]|uniref:BolA family protein n=1 Tax=Thiocystis violacea TaxID=13725 RepID=UPI001905DA33|nr:BolA/IbaG family iron-sulfur metabolism protein [Thiocystis violacea]MBK1723415.1 BolA family transcriptional regulator [Thiocystis violacea]
MNRKQRIESKIQDAIQPVHLDVVDESYMHAVPPDSESHFKLLVVSDSFQDMPLIERHRRINELLGEELGAGLHAVTMHTWTADEWQEKGGVPESPPCQGGSKATG